MTLSTNHAGLRLVELREYEPVDLDRDFLTGDDERSLYERWSSQVSVDAPSYKTGHRWRLTAQGYVGHLPVSETLSIRIAPKVPIKNLIGMLEYAYGLRSFQIFDGAVDCDDLDDLMSVFAKHLAYLVLRRTRQGLHRSYVEEHDRLGFVRGRLDTTTAIREPWRVDVPCRFEEHTADVVENQVLAWTLGVIMRNPDCNEDARRFVGHAARTLHGHISSRRFTAADVDLLHYHRLTQDYEPMHRLCRFFLENTGPAIEHGDRTILPFVVNMARLFELFVFRWLEEHLPARYEIRAQEDVKLAEGRLQFRIDLVLSDRETGRAIAVLDTKYKAPESPSTDDVAQVMAYAQMKQVRDSVLIYPTELSSSVDTMIGESRVRSLTFLLGGGLQHAGSQLVDQLLK